MIRPGFEPRTKRIVTDRPCGSVSARTVCGRSWVVKASKALSPQWTELQESLMGKSKPGEKK